MFVAMVTNTVAYYGAELIIAAKKLYNTKGRLQDVFKYCNKFVAMVTNTLAYCGAELIVASKCFFIQSPTVTAPRKVLLNKKVFGAN
jgi:hypothetical protein